MLARFEQSGYHALGVLSTLESQMADAVTCFRTRDPFSRLYQDIVSLNKSREGDAGSGLHSGDLLPICQKLWAASVLDLLSGHPAHVFPADRLNMPCEPLDMKGRFCRDWKGYPAAQLYNAMELRKGEACVVEVAVPTSEYERICQELIGFKSPFLTHHVMHVSYLLASLSRVPVENVVVSYAHEVVFRLPSPALLIQSQALPTGARVVFTNDFLAPEERRVLLKEGFLPVPLSYTTLFGPFVGFSQMCLGSYTVSMHPLYAMYLGIWNMKLETQWD